MDTLPKIKLYQPLLMMLVVILAIFWIINAFNTGNAFWFLPVQPEFEPSRIIVRAYGTAVTLQKGDPGYEPIAAALNESFSGFANTSLVSIGISEETLRRYHEEELVLEAYYPGEIQFNTTVRMQGVNQLLIPIDGTHDDKRYLFFGNNGSWRVGAMVMRDDTPIRQALSELGYLESNPS